VSAALTAPFLVAGTLLVVSGLSKLRSPGVAAQALLVLGAPVGRSLVRVGAVLETALGALALISGGRAVAIAVAAAFAVFAGVGLALARRRVACGCFGSHEAPATRAQALASVALSGLCIAAAVGSPGGVGWVLDRGPASAAVLGLAIAACVYGTVVAYTELPAAWEAWSGR